MSNNTNFFESPSEKSKVKTLIVTDFLKAYFPIINNSVGKDKNEIQYIDLYCGPGEYNDGQPSTPLALLNLLNSHESDSIVNKLQIVFNDENAESIKKLNEIIDKHEVTKKLKYKPHISNISAGAVDIKSYTNKNCPIFSFIDPWGYKDISAELIWSLVENIGSDCVLFFNSNRCLMDINKESQTCHFKPIFGDSLPEVVKVVNSTLSQKVKTEKIVNLFSTNLWNNLVKTGYSGYKLYILPFDFEADDREKISHHILFITKSHKAIIEMKKVMQKYSNSNNIQFCFDSKDQFQTTFINRTNYIEDAISDDIKLCFQKNMHYFNSTWKIDTLLEALDTCYMNFNYRVTPYCRDELKKIIELLDNKGAIEIKIPIGKRANRRITYDREFKVKKEILV